MASGSALWSRTEAPYVVAVKHVAVIPRVRRWVRRALGITLGITLGVPLGASRPTYRVSMAADATTKHDLVDSHSQQTTNLISFALGIALGTTFLPTPTKNRLLQETAD